ncbi:nucleoside 2-deoxyribosyltransferase [Candidatus Gottesmanbacteria bacterium]|nr:nucleoside 2-deoxyribosyltransferase [Candidatus Gottesmanbacteria bacterium]
MRIFFAGPLTNLTHPDKTKAFYRKLEEVAKKYGCDYFWAFRHGTDPVANPRVTPRDVYERDIAELEKSDVMVAYVGEPSTGTGLEIEHAHHKGIPVYLLYEQGKKVSRMLRGCPAVKKELVFTDEPDALSQFDTLLQFQSFNT